MDYYILSYQIMFPRFRNLYYSIELLVVGGVVENHPLKDFRMVAYMPSTLHLDHSH